MSILSFISGRHATKSNQIKQLIRNGRSASLQRTFKKSFTSFSHSTRNKTRDGLIRVRNIRAFKGSLNPRVTHAYSIVIGSKQFTLNAPGGGFLTASKQFRHGATNKSRSNFFSHAEDGIRHHCVTGVQTCALPILLRQPADLDVESPYGSPDCSSGPSEERRAGQGIHTVTLHPGLPVVVVDGLLVRVARLVALVAFVQLAVAAVPDAHPTMRAVDEPALDLPHLALVEGPRRPSQVPE